MIFAIGAPESFAVPREVAAATETLDIACSENGEYIATVTSSGVFIWSAGQSRVLLAHVAPPIDEHDVIWRAIWSANSSQLAVLTLASLVVVYDVAVRGGDDVVLDFHFASTAPARPFVNLPPLPRVEIREASSFHVAAGIACATALADSLLVLAKDDRIVAYTWTGEIRAVRELASIHFPAAAAAAVPPPPPTAAATSSTLKRSASNSSSGSSNRLLRSDSVEGDDESLMSAADAEFASRRPDLRGVGVAVAVAASLALHCIALVFNTGHSVLLCAPAAVDVVTLLASVRGVWLDAVDATCVALNAHHKLLSVGCANAAVHIYNVERQHANARSAVLLRLRTFSLRHWGIEASAVGPVTGLRWSPDESALCVGWQRRGVSVWSIYGCRLMCTVSQTASGKAEFAMAGVTSVCWTRDGFFLLVATARSHMQSSSSATAAAAPAVPQSGNAAEWRAAFHQLSFVKNSLATNPTMSAGGRLLLLGSDRLYYLTWPKHKPAAASASAGGGRARADSSASELGDTVPSEIAWRHLPIPQSYLASSWPIEHAAVSRDGSQLAIAGKRGIALYNTATTRWKLFGDEREERRVVCRGLCWFGRDVVIAVVRPSGDDSGGGGAKDDAPCELRCYPRSHLSEHACLHRSPLPGRREPRFIDCNGLFLVLFTRDAFFYQFELVPHCGPNGKVRRIDTRLVHQVSMAGVAADPLLLSLLPPPSRTSVHSSQATVDGSTGKSLPNMYGSATCLVLNASGDLSLTNAEDNQQMTLAHAVEQFWLSSDDARRDIGSTLWAHGQAGVQVWFPFAVGHEIHAMKLMSRDQSLEFDLEVYPVGFVPELAVVVGIAQRVEPTPGASVPSFVLHTKTHPFLHSILRHLLETGAEEHAFDIATRFASVPHFVHSLELLLHETLQDDYSSVPAARSPTRPGTPQRTNRPSSPAPPSLAAAAAAAATASSSSSSANLSTPQRRASFQRDSPLLQRVVEFLRRFPQFPEVVMAVARKMDVKFWRALFHFVGDPAPLFERCVESRHVHMAASYLRILQNIAGVAASRRAALKLLELALEQEDIELAGDLARFLEPMSTPDVLDDIDAARDDEEFYTQELLLGRYARNLLHHLNLRDLLRFARLVAHEIRPWLARERLRAATVADWSTALQLLHTQFDVLFPNQISDAQIRAFQRAVASGAEPAATVAAVSAEGASTSDDLHYLLGELVAARCFELVLLVATLLLELGTVAATLRVQTALMKPYIHMLHVQPVAGYQQLRELIQQQKL